MFSSYLPRSLSIEVSFLHEKVFTSIECLFAFLFVAWSAAGRCYQCNSRNPLCELYVNATLKIDGTPCNGQCYTRLNRDDESTISRGCSWEHGFMNPQTRNSLILSGNSVWVFCDTP